MENTKLRTASEKLLDGIIDIYRRHETISGELPKEAYTQCLDIVLQHNREIHEECVGAMIIATNRKEFIAPKYVDR